MSETGMDRNRTYTREELCERFGYPAITTDPIVRKNRNRFFRERFLNRGLPAVQVGNTYLISGEMLFSWTLCQSRPTEAENECGDDAKPVMRRAA